MLYDPKWNKPSVDGFVAWLEMQPADGTYVYSSCDVCAIAQYMRAVGTSYHAQMTELPIGGWNTFITQPKPHTFGAAAERAREYANRCAVADALL